MFSNGDRVHFPGDPDDTGVLFDDDGRLSVLWLRPCDDDPEFDAVDPETGRILGMELADPRGLLRVQPVVH